MGTTLKGDRISLPVSTSDPSSVAAGDMYFNSAGDKLKIRNSANDGWGEVTFAPLGTANNPAVSGSDLVGQPSGSYFVQTASGSAVETYVDTTTYGGGWVMVSRNTTYSQWSSASNVERNSNTTNFYSVLRGDFAFSEIWIKWNGGGAAYSGTALSDLKNASNITYTRTNGDDLVNTGYSQIGTEDDTKLYIRLTCPGHRGTVFSNYLNNSNNQGGFMEWCGPYASTTTMTAGESETVTYYEVYVR